MIVCIVLFEIVILLVLRVSVFIKLMGKCKLFVMINVILFVFCLFKYFFVLVSVGIVGILIWFLKILGVVLVLLLWLLRMM